MEPVSRLDDSVEALQRVLYANAAMAEALRFIVSGEGAHNCTEALLRHIAGQWEVSLTEREGEAMQAVVRRELADVPIVAGGLVHANEVNADEF